MQAKQSSPICEHCGYDERNQNAPHQLPVGTVLRGQYLLGRVLGQGGFGITYLGRDLDLDIPVAIKEYYPSGMVSREARGSLNVSLSTGDFAPYFSENRDRFLREARTLAALEGVPEVVQVKSYFAANNTAYIVMGYVKGITLQEHLRRSGGKLKAHETLRLVEPLLKALGQVHAQGLVHRDISPDNIMLQPNGQLRLIDFGAAHAATADGNKSTQAVLKHGFAPPEQYQRKGQLGPWTDVYAICATIYNCITGRTPPTSTDRMLGEEDFHWEALIGLNDTQCAALKQGLAIQNKARIQSMEELSNSLFVKKESTPEVSETGTLALGHKSNASTQYAPIYTAPLDPPTPKSTCGHESIQKETSRDAKRKTSTKKKLPFFRIVTPILVAILIALLVYVLSPFCQISPLTKGSRVLMVHNDLDASAFRTGIDRHKIVSITFMDTTSIPPNAVDASENWDDSVSAWVTYYDGEYHLYIAANGAIIAPENCSHMFQGFTQLKHINLNRLDTSNVTDMSYMFSGTTNLKNVDATFDVSKVTNYQSFMDQTDLFNRRPWKFLFQ